MEELTRELEEIVRERLADWPAQWEGYHWPGYTWEHTLRVRNLALRLAGEMGADQQVVELAALLHDIEKRVGREHAAVGAEEAARLLSERGVNGDLAERITHAIASHAGGNTPEHPVENLVLGDADLIDANFGLVGVWRFITIRAGHGTGVEETILAMSEWLPKKDELLQHLRTEAGRATAAERRSRMHEFCTELAEALSGGETGATLLALATHINAEHARGSITAQLPALCTIASARADQLALGAVQRLADEAAGRV